MFGNIKPNFYKKQPSIYPQGGIYIDEGVSKYEWDVYSKWCIKLINLLSKILNYSNALAIKYMFNKFAY